MVGSVGQDPQRLLSLMQKTKEKYFDSFTPAGHFLVPSIGCGQADAALPHSIGTLERQPAGDTTSSPSERAGQEEDKELTRGHADPGLAQPNMLGSFSTFTAMTSPHPGPDRDKSIASHKSWLVGTPG